jgi:hypothetical protein
MDLGERYRGSLLGLAVGDAVGTTLEFRQPGSFDPLEDMVGGGPFGLKPGEWTDDTSMALCLAASWGRLRPTGRCLLWGARHSPRVAHASSATSPHRVSCRPPLRAVAHG